MLTATGGYSGSWKRSFRGSPTSNGRLIIRNGATSTSRPASRAGHASKQRRNGSTVACRRRRALPTPAPSQRRQVRRPGRRRDFARGLQRTPISRRASILVSSSRNSLGGGSRTSDPAERPGAPAPLQCRVVRLLSLRPGENGRSPESDERLLRYESWHVHVGRCNRCRKREGALDHIKGGF